MPKAAEASVRKHIDRKDLGNFRVGERVVGYRKTYRKRRANHKGRVARQLLEVKEMERTESDRCPGWLGPADPERKRRSKSRRSAA
jgi:hypothetical protein